MRKGLALLALVACVSLSTLLQVGNVSAQNGKVCFGEVPDCIEGRFAEYWQQNGGLPVFGYPISPASQQTVGGVTTLVQQFERNRFELRTENARPYDVLLGRLGAERLQALGRQWENEPKAPATSKAGCAYFGETQHLVCDQFLAYWSNHGLNLDGRRGYTAAESLALFGLPLTEATLEQGSDGQSYLTQWFERARFELHPEVGNVVLLGLLGKEQSAPQSTPPAADPGLPASQNAAAEPQVAAAGTTFAFAAYGFEPGEKAGVYVTAPNQAVVGAPFQVNTDDKGFTEVVTFRTQSDFPQGVYAVTFEGVKSGRKAIAYFRITAP